VLFLPRLLRQQTYFFGYSAGAAGIGRGVEE
jgi:hypothetical protein